MSEIAEPIWYLDPVLYIASAGVAIGVLSFVLNFWTKRHSRSRLFSDDYRTEIKHLASFFSNLMSQNAPYSNALWIIFHHDQSTGRRALQHLYTCKKTRKIYEIVKNYYETNTDKPNQAAIFCDKFRPTWLSLMSSVNPDFGACNECIEHIKLKHVQKHKKTLKQCDDSMWDFIFD